MQHSQQLNTKKQTAPSHSLLTRIMALDDEAVDQMICKRVINRSGLAQEVVGITTPVKALAYFADLTNPTIDLILLDVNMPVMNGFEFLEAAQAILEPGRIPPVLLMLSAPLGPIHRQQAFETSLIKGYLDKPLDRTALERAILSIKRIPYEVPKPKLV